MGEDSFVILAGLIPPSNTPIDLYSESFRSASVIAWRDSVQLKQRAFKPNSLE